VTYVVFPGTGPKPRIAPDYAAWHEECSKLLGEIGGLGAGYTLHEWEDTLKQVEEVPEVSEFPTEEADSVEYP